MNKYLIGIDWDLFGGIPDIYVTKHHIKGWRYFSTYSNGNLRKQLIFKKLAEHDMIENQGAWDWHHVVEGKHLKPLYSSSDYNWFYEHEWPTVLIHAREEHHILNSLFRSSGTSIGLQPSGTTPLIGNERKIYLGILYQRYQDIYTGNPIFSKIAHNVIKNLF